PLLGSRPEVDRLLHHLAALDLTVHERDPERPVDDARDPLIEHDRCPGDHVARVLGVDPVRDHVELTDVLHLDAVVADGAAAAEWGAGWWDDAIVSVGFDRHRREE